MSDEDKRKTSLQADEEKRLPPEVVQKREDFFNQWNKMEQYFNHSKNVPKEELTFFLTDCRYWILRFQGYCNSKDYKELADMEDTINRWFTVFPQNSKETYTALRNICLALRTLFKRYRLDDILLEDALLW